MRQLRAYLLVKKLDGGWVVSVHRELEEIVSEWKLVRDDVVGAVLHVGFWRPDSECFDALVSKFSGLLLMTESSKLALPVNFSSSQRAVGFVGGFRVFLALAGWGYDAPDPSSFEGAVEGSPESRELPRRQESSQFSSEWLHLLAQSDADLFAAAASFGIIDEGAYLELESGLPIPIRISIGLKRFISLAGCAPSPDAILTKLECAPPWLLQMPISALAFSTRTGNVFTANEVHHVSDLRGFGAFGLLKLPNMGRKSLREVGEVLVELIEGGEAAIAWMLRCSNISGENCREITRNTSKNEDASTSVGSLEVGGLIPAPASLLTLFESLMESLNEREAHILRRRMGLHSERMTLQQVADGLGITRERVRQIESKALGKIKQNPKLALQFVDPIESALLGRESPLYVAAVEEIAPQFWGANLHVDSLEYSAENFLSPPVYILDKGAFPFLSRLAPDEWAAAKRQARVVLKSGAQQRLPESDLRVLISALLVGGGEELRSHLWALSTEHAHFAQSGGQNVLVGYGYSAESLVRSILAASEGPLHYEEVFQRILDEGYDVDGRRVHHACQEVAVLLGRGVYGLERHIPFSDEECDLIRQYAEDLLTANASTRQWHSAEILDALREDHAALGEGANPYVLSAILRKSKALSYLGRMTWAVASVAERMPQERIDIHQIVVSVIQAAGKPLTSEEIRRAVVSERGVNVHFQVQPLGPIVRIGVGRWGLVDRDVPLTLDEQGLLLASLMVALEQRQEGIHVVELLDSVPSAAHLIQRLPDPVAVLGLAQKVDGFSIAKGGEYVYLTKWGEVRRLSVADAVEHVLRAAGEQGIDASAGCREAALLLRRPFIKSHWGPSCYAVGATFDERDRVWRLPASGGRGVNVLSSA